MLTVRQKKVFDFIEAYQLRTGGVSPSFDEILMGTNEKGRGTVFNVLSRLEERGFIRRLKNRGRAIEIIRTWHPPRYKTFQFDDASKTLKELTPDAKKEKIAMTR